MPRILLPDFVLPEISTLSGMVDTVRAKTPLVQCLTNAVVMQFTANVVLAAGGSPAMVDIADEAGPFARIASGVLINVGTPYANRREAMVEAAHSAQQGGTPWVLDPVAVGALPVRTALASDLLEFRPTAIRGNASEIVALAGQGVGGRGTDSTAHIEEAFDAALSLSRHTGAVVCVSGERDLIVQAGHSESIAQVGTPRTDRVVCVDNGSELLTKVTGGGCALGAVVAAYLGILRTDPFLAAVLAHSVYGVAAEYAERQASGPGTFAVHFVDALAAADGGAFAAHGRVTVADDMAAKNPENS
ncbi:hydroxyethylthiazole kinase [Populibacterium corticicola]|uniref:Hydroxyethylthiazole kinase n=1 Tax=Populibacterium corticicola TaxID=1812826 RepID=A0ABW5XCK2_9MICO